MNCFEILNNQGKQFFQLLLSVHFARKNTCNIHPCVHPISALLILVSVAVLAISQCYYERSQFSVLGTDYSKKKN